MAGLDGGVGGGGWEVGVLVITGPRHRGILRPAQVGCWRRWVGGGVWPWCKGACALLGEACSGPAATSTGKQESHTPEAQPCCCCSQRVAIEADGPVHYSSNTRHLLGPTALKRRLLAQLGWAIVDVPYYDWGELEGRREQQEYMRQKLEATGLDLAAIWQPPDAAHEAQGWRLQEAESAAGALGSSSASGTTSSSSSSSSHDLGAQQGGLLDVTMPSSRVDGMPEMASSSSSLLGSSDTLSSSTTGGVHVAHTSSSGSEEEEQEDLPPDPEGPGQQQQRRQQQERPPSQDTAVAAVQERLRRLAMLDFAKGKLSRHGLVAKEGNLRVAERQRRQKR